MSQFKTLDEVWKALDDGKTVCWHSDSYQLTVEDSHLDWRKDHGFGIPFSNRGESCLRVTCMSNWFGSLLNENELGNLYVKESL